MMFDLDRFKSVNDRFGHGVGDEALRVFGATASTNLRASDVLGRLGGEEFAAVLPGTVEDASIAAERVRRAFQVAGVSVAGCLLDATVSIGVASGEPGSDVMGMLVSADAALYRAKIKGRNRVELEKDVPGLTMQELVEPAFEWHVEMPVAQPAVQRLAQTAVKRARDEAAGSAPRMHCLLARFQPAASRRRLRCWRRRAMVLATTAKTVRAK